MVAMNAVNDDESTGHCIPVAHARNWQQAMKFFMDFIFRVAILTAKSVKT